MSKELKLLVDEFLPFAKQRFGYDQPVSINFADDVANAADPMGKTAYYDPSSMSVTVFVTDRHPKDVLRSLSHELVHHAQNCRGEFDKLNSQDMGEGYAQDNPHLREMEIEAFREGSMCLRDWSDRRKKTSYNETSLQGVKNKMSINEKKRRNVGGLLTEKWGFSFNMLNESMDEGMCPKCNMSPCGCDTMEEAKKDDVALAHEKHGTSSRIVPDSEINSIESFNDWRMGLSNPDDWEDAQSHRGGRILAYHRMDSGKPVGKYYDVQSDMYVSDDEMMDILPEGEMPDKNDNGVPDFAEDGEGGEGENDMGKAADLEDMNEMSGVAAVAGHVDPRKQALREKVTKLVEAALNARLNNKEDK